LAAFPSRIVATVLGFMFTVAPAVATRNVGSLPLTSTITARPLASKWVKLIDHLALRPGGSIRSSDLADFPDLQIRIFKGRKPVLIRAPLSDTPIFRQTSVTGVPVSPCRSAKAICSSEPSPRNTPFFTQEKAFVCEGLPNIP
jgi:hypothetical protein